MYPERDEYKWGVVWDRFYHIQAVFHHHDIGPFGFMAEIEQGPSMSSWRCPECGASVSGKELHEKIIEPAKERARQKEAQKLKPCPFCGNENCVLQNGKTSGGYDFYVVHCDRCFSHGPHVIVETENGMKSGTRTTHEKAYQSALNQWNRRS